MKIKEAIDRLRFTISKQNKPNATDAEAFNEILILLNKTQQETLHEHQLFAKLYTFLLCEFTQHYGNIDFANKEINKILTEPLHANRLQMILKSIEYQKYFQRNNVLDSFLKDRTTAELERIHDQYKDTFSELDPIEFAKCGNNWDIESVNYQLENAINLSIQNFKNNV